MKQFICIKCCACRRKEHSDFFLPLRGYHHMHAETAGHLQLQPTPAETQRRCLAARRRYAHQMFRQLRVLDYFDFWMKMDDDVRWAKPFPGDFNRHLVTKHAIFFHSGARSEGCRGAPDAGHCGWDARGSMHALHMRGAA